jgi:hypothetical protein
LKNREAIWLVIVAWGKGERSGRLGRGFGRKRSGEQRVLPGRNNKPKKMWRLSKQEQAVEVEALESELEYTRTFLRKYNFV